MVLSSVNKQLFNNNIFAKVPNLDLSVLRVVQSIQPKKLQFWVEGRSLLNTVESSSDLSIALGELARLRLDPQPATQLFKILLSTCEQALVLLEKNYLAEQFYLLARTQAKVEAAQLLDLQIVSAGKSILWRFSSLNSLDLQQIELIHFCGLKIIESYSRLLARWSSFYLSPPNGFWLEANGVYQFLESIHKGYSGNESSVKNSSNSNLFNAQFKSEYIALLASGLLELHRYDRKHLGSIFEFVRSIARDLALVTSHDTNVLSDSDAIFGIDLAVDSCLVPSRFMEKPTESCRFMVGMSQVLHNKEHKSKSYTLKNLIQEEILARLSQEFMRNSARDYTNLELKCHFGIVDLHAALQLMSINDKNSQKVHQALDADTSNDFGDNEIDYAKLATSDGRVSNAVSQPTLLKVLDKSDKGYRFEKKLNFTKKTREMRFVKPGELLLIEGDGPSKLGVIRWLKFNKAHCSVTFGVELVGHSVIPIGITAQGENMENTSLAMLYRLPNQQALNDNLMILSSVMFSSTNQWTISYAGQRQDISIQNVQPFVAGYEFAEVCEHLTGFI